MIVKAGGSRIEKVLVVALSLWFVSVGAFLVPHHPSLTSAQKSVLIIKSSSSSSEDDDTIMSAQERILRNAGLWDEKAQSERAEKAKIALQEQKQQMFKNIAVAVVSVGLALGNYFWTYSQSVYTASSANNTPANQRIVAKTPYSGAAVDETSSSQLTSQAIDNSRDGDDTQVQLPYSQNQPSIPPLQLLARMTEDSDPMSVIGTNGKPTVVDFWAPWCDNCKLAAPTLSKIEAEYKGQINFVMINCDGNANARSWSYVRAFGVDAIPHLALVNAEGDVETALIGPIPKTVLEADFNTLIENAKSGKEKKELPYTMLDVFANKPEKRRVSFDP